MIKEKRKKLTTNKLEKNKNKLNYIYKLKQLKHYSFKQELSKSRIINV